MPSDPTMPGPPRQVRSRRTHERLLTATEGLLERSPFESITVRDIVTRARSSIGSFYARFADKQALLPALYARYESSLAARLADLERALAGPGQTLESTAAQMVEHFVRLYGERPNLMRALVEHVRRDPGAIDDATRERRRAQHQFMRLALIAGAARSGHATSERAVATALFVVDAACRERLLYPHAAHARAVQLGEGDLVDELVGVLIACVVSDATKRARPRHPEPRRTT